MSERLYTLDWDQVIGLLIEDSVVKANLLFGEKKYSIGFTDDYLIKPILHIPDSEFIRTNKDIFLERRIIYEKDITINVKDRCALLYFGYIDDSVHISWPSRILYDDRYKFAFESTKATVRRIVIMT